MRWDTTNVRILCHKSNQLLREYLRQKPGRYRIAPTDVPRRTPKSTLELLARAHSLGKHIGELCDILHRSEGEVCVRRILGFLSLTKKYGPGTVDRACAEAIELQVCNYRFVRRYLERAPAAPVTLRQSDPLIHELSHYPDLINNITQEATPSESH